MLSDSEAAPASTWDPLRQPLFRALWIAAVMSNIGTWIHGIGAAWLMTSLTPAPRMVALVQAASSLPMFLFALPAGALADIIDRRRLLLLAQAWMLGVSAALGALTLAGATTPWVLLTLTFALGLGAALNAPTWQAIVPEVVPRKVLPAAIALNSVSINIARALGPALGGLIIAAAGAGATFMVNAVSFLGVMWVIYHWRRAPRHSMLPAERVIGAVRVGMRYVRHAPAVKSALVRSGVFISFGIALLALLPVIARFELGLGPEGYGTLMGSMGMGALAGAVVLPCLRGRVTTDRLVAGATILFAVVLLIIAAAPHFSVVCAAMFMGGGAWLTLLATFNTRIQAAVPSWVRGRVLSVSVLVFFGGMALGSAVWGNVASFFGIPFALTSAAAGMVLGLFATRRYRLATGEELNLDPSLHWPAPAVAKELVLERGPVCVTVEYRIDPAHLPDFLLAMRQVRAIRLRDGAIRWALLGDVADAARYVESFVVESWVEHLRQHERVTLADRATLDQARVFHLGDTLPVVHHFIFEPLPDDT